MATKRESREESGLVDQLREAIRGSGQSLTQLSKVCGVDSGRLSRFMRGERGLTLDAAERIFRVLGLHVVKKAAPADVREVPPGKKARRTRRG